MKTKQLIAAALVFSAAGAAFAQPGDTYGFLGVNNPAATQDVAASKTRAEVAQQLTEGGTPTYSFLGVSQPGNDKIINRGKTRAEVVAELKQAETDGTLQVASFAGFRSPTTTKVDVEAPQAVANK
jgi:hypothetical protein